MDFINFFIDFLRNPQEVLSSWINTFGAIWVYAPLFLVIFIETGLVIMPFLPGDSLLFAAGIFAADNGPLNIFALIFLLSLAAVLGNTSNYWIGRKVGQAIIDSKKVKALTPERIEETQKMFDKYGLLAVALTRFFPIIRTFAPFLAGLGKMHFGKFTIFNVIGGVSWVTLFSLLGYFFGNAPIVQENFETVIIAIVIISLIPTFAGLVKAKFTNKNKASSED